MVRRGRRHVRDYRYTVCDNVSHMDIVDKCVRKSSLSISLANCTGICVVPINLKFLASATIMNILLPIVYSSVAYYGWSITFGYNVDRMFKSSLLPFENVLEFCGIINYNPF